MKKVKIYFVGITTIIVLVLCITANSQAEDRSCNQCYPSPEMLTAGYYNPNWGDPCYAYSKYCGLTSPCGPGYFPQCNQQKCMTSISGCYTITP